MSDIWHVSGGQTVTRTLAAGTSASGEPYLSSDTDGQWPEGVLGVTTQLVRLLEAHYIVAYAGAGSADNRAAQVVEAWRDRRQPGREVLAGRGRPSSRSSGRSSTPPPM